MNIDQLTVQSTLGVKKLEINAIIPTKSHDGDLGYDLYALQDTALGAGMVTKVSTGIAFDFPVGYGGLLRDRSSVATKAELFVVAGVIDQGYKGEVCVALYNPISVISTRQAEILHKNPRSNPISTSVTELGETKYIKAGDRIAQLILIPVITLPIIEVNDLSDSSRGTGGFGSTGA